MCRQKSPSLQRRIPTTALDIHVVNWAENMDIPFSSPFLVAVRDMAIYEAKVAKSVKTGLDACLPGGTA